MSDPGHHLSLSKVKAFDGLMYVVGVGGNLAAVPQVLLAWDGPAPGLAISTWLIFSGISLLWLIYAIIHQQRPLIWAQSVGLACNIAVVLGWLWHRL